MSDNSEYELALECLKYDYSLPSIFKELKQFIEKVYDIKVSGFLFDQVKFLPQEPYRLQVLLLSKKDQKKMMLKNPKVYGFDSEKQDKVLRKFKELNQIYSFSSDNKLEECFVVFTNIGFQIMINLNDTHIKEAEIHIKEEYKNLNIWAIDSWVGSVYVFFKTNIELEKYQETGVIENIKKSYLKFIKQYDEFGVYEVNEMTMEFCSKEIIDKEYNGSINLFFRSR